MGMHGEETSWCCKHINSVASICKYLGPLTQACMGYGRDWLLAVTWYGSESWLQWHAAAAKWEENLTLLVGSGNHRSVFSDHFQHLYMIKITANTRWLWLIGMILMLSGGVFGIHHVEKLFTFSWYFDSHYQWYWRTAVGVWNVAKHN